MSQGDRTCTKTGNVHLEHVKKTIKWECENWCFYFCLLLLAHLVLLFKRVPFQWFWVIALFFLNQRYCNNHFAIPQILQVIMHCSRLLQPFYAKQEVLLIILLYCSSKSFFPFSSHCQLQKVFPYLSPLKREKSSVPFLLQSSRSHSLVTAT